MDRAGRRVVVTGMGAVTPVGLDAESSWEALREGRGGVGPVRRFDAGGFATRIAAELKGFDLSRDLGDDAARWEGHGRNTQLALAVAAQAVRDSGLFEGRAIDPARFGVYLGSGEGQADFPRFVDLVRRSLDGDRVDTRRFTGMGIGLLDPLLEAEQEPGTPAGHLATAFGARGPNLSCLTACSASAQAIGEATELIRGGSVDIMLAGGVHSMIHPFGLTGFILLTAMSTRNDDPARASRPFDRDRDGFVLGEGGGMLVLEALDHARARGAAIYGEVAGQASTADAFRLTDCHDEGRGAVAAMRLALADSGLNPEDVDYVNAHGTSTKVNDSVETLALEARARRPRAEGARVEHQEHDRSSDRRRRGRRGDRLPAGDPRRSRAADHQSRQPGRRLRPRLRRSRGARPFRRRRDVQQLRIRWAEHDARPPSFSRLSGSTRSTPEAPKGDSYTVLPPALGLGEHGDGLLAGALGGRIAADHGGELGDALLLVQR